MRLGGGLPHLLLLFAWLTILAPELGNSPPQSGPGIWFLVHTIPFEDTELRTWEGPYFNYKDCDDARVMQLKETPGENLSCLDGSGLDL